MSAAMTVERQARSDRQCYLRAFNGGAAFQPPYRPHFSSRKKHSM